MKIPDEAVAAAVKVYRETSWNDRATVTCRALLEAAAPHLMEAAWNQGLTAGIRSTRGNAEPNPYRAGATE